MLMDRNPNKSRDSSIISWIGKWYTSLPQLVYLLYTLTGYGDGRRVIIIIIVINIYSIKYTVYLKTHVHIYVLLYKETINKAVRLNWNRSQNIIDHAHQ